MALTKILNDENKSFQPVLTDKLVYDTKPTVNSFNGITSDAVARAIAGASGEVPQVTESDNGKVLTAVYDAGGPAVEWAEAQSGSSYTFSAPLKDNNGTVALKYSSDQFKKEQASETRTPARALYTGNGYYYSLSDNSTVYLYSIRVKVPQALRDAYTQGKYIYPVICDRYGLGWDYAMDYEHYVRKSVSVNSSLIATVQFSICLNKNSQYAPIELKATEGANPYANPALAFGVFDTSDPEEPIDRSNIYGADGDDQAITDYYGDEMLLLMNPVPTILSDETGYILGQKQSANGYSYEPAWVNPMSLFSIGDGLEANGNKLSVKYGPGLTLNDVVTNQELKATVDNVSGTYKLRTLGQLTPAAVAYFKNNPAAVITPKFEFQCNTYTYRNICIGIIASRSIGRNDGTVTIPTSTLSSTTLAADVPVTLDFTNLVRTGYSWEEIESNTSDFYLAFGTYGDFGLYLDACGAHTFAAQPEFEEAVASTCTATVEDALVVENPVPSITGNAGKLLSVNSGATGMEWVAPIDYTMVYNTTPAGGSMDETPWQAVQAGKRIGVVVPYSAFSGSLAAGSLYSSGKIYMPLASVVDRGSGEYRWNFYLYDGANKWSLALTCDEDEWSWGTPNVVAG